MTPTVSVGWLIACRHFARGSVVAQKSIERVSAPLVVVLTAEPLCSHGLVALGNLAVRNVSWSFKSIELSVAPSVVMRIAKPLCPSRLMASVNTTCAGDWGRTRRLPALWVVQSTPLLIVCATVTAAFHLLVAPYHVTKPHLLFWFPTVWESGTSRSLIVAPTVAARIMNAITLRNAARTVAVLLSIRHGKMTVSALSLIVND